MAFGATLPGSGTTLSTVLLSEVITTFTMVALLSVFPGFQTIRGKTAVVTGAGLGVGEGSDDTRS